MAWLVDLGVDAGTTSLLCVGGRQEGQGVWRRHRNTLARAHLFTQSVSQAASHSLRQTKRKEEQHPAGGQHTPRGMGHHTPASRWGCRRR